MRGAHLVLLLVAVLGTSNAAADLPRLLGQLESPDPKTRAAAAVAIGELGVAGGAATCDLIGRLDDRDDRVAGRAGWALTRVGPAPADQAPRLLGFLTSESPEVVRDAATEALVRMGESAVPALTRGLKQAQQQPVRLALVTVLRRIGQPAGAAVVLLVRLMANPSADQRRAVGEALTAIGSPDSRGLRHLLPLAAHDDPAVRAAAVGALGASRRAAVTPTLILRLSDEAGVVRGAAGTALVRVGAAAVPRLVGALRTKDAPALLRRMLIAVLGRIGRPAGRAMSTLATQATDPDLRVRRDAILAIGRIGSPARPAVRALTRALDDPDTPARTSAVQGLGQLRAQAGPAVPKLVTLLASDRSITVREAVAATLARIGRPAGPIATALAEALGDEFTVRTQAMDALKVLGAPAVPALAKALSTAKTGDARRAAALALGRLAAHGAPAVPALIEALQDTVHAVRFAARATLRAILATSKSPEVRAQIAATLPK